ncbi:MAG TPA: hypothetical protein VFB15_11020 [Candidatus Binataceae bacterium]|jgi:hypothetical protein|nr:hypothetical protein [Candidatus Binataceae bacterium]
MQINEFILGAIAVWRISHLLVNEDGPGDIMKQMREIARGGFWGKVLECFYCLSLWVAAPATLLLARDWRGAMLLWPGLSGAAIMLERITVGGQPIAGEHYLEEEETPDVLR